MKVTSKTNKATATAVNSATANYKANRAKVVAKIGSKAASSVTSNFWKKLRELGSYAHGVKLYCLRSKDYVTQTLVDWQGCKGKDERKVLYVRGTRGLAMMLVHCKGTAVRVSADKAIELASFKSATLLSMNSAIALVKSKGKAESAFNYDGRTYKGHLLDSGEFYSVFTDGKALFEGEASRISGKSLEQAKHVWSLG